MAMIFKNSSADIQSGGDGTRTFVFSTGGIDRDGDTVSVAGWKVDNYLKNPVVLWAHDYSALPIGRCTAVRVRGDALVGDIQFAQTEFAQSVLALVDAGVISAVSVGFRPISGQARSDGSGTDFSEQELLEVSCVPVPSQPAALIQRGLNVAPIVKWANGVLSKRGRVLNADNEAHVRQAQQLCQDAAQHCSDVLASLDGDGIALDDEKAHLFDVDGDSIGARLAERAANAVRRSLTTKWHGSGDIDISAIPPLGDSRGRAPRRRSPGWSDYYGSHDGHEEIGFSRQEVVAAVSETFREMVSELLRDEIEKGIARGRGRIVD